MKKPSLAPLRGQLTLFLITRIILDTGFRMVYPFLPTFARALGVDISSISLAITARATLMATSITAAAGGRALGALISPVLFDIHLLASSAFGAAMAIIALPILIIWVKVE